MSININQLLLKDFETEVITKFQFEGGLLRPYVRMKPANGNQVQFKVGGIAYTQERSLGTPLPNYNATRTPIVVTVKNYTATALTDIFLNNQINHDDIQEDVNEIVMGLRRREDQLIINALNATSSPGTVANNISGSTANLTVEAFIAAASYHDKKNVATQGRVALIHANGKNALLANTKTTSHDYVDVKALIRGDIDTFYGYKVLWVGDFNVEPGVTGGLPINGSLDRTNFFYHPNSIGYAVNMNPVTRVDYESQSAAHRVTGFLSANAVTLQDDGVVKVTTRES